MTVFNVTCGTQDNFLANGDSITFGAWGTGYPGSGTINPNYSQKIQALYPPYSGLFVNNGVPGETSINGANEIANDLANNPRYPIVACNWGTNDAGTGSGISTSQYKSNMDTIIQTVLNAGKIPIIQRIPYATNPTYSAIPSYNAQIDALVSKYNLHPGPDLYTFFFNNQSLLSGDGVHPSINGYIAMIGQWGAAMAWLYGH